MSAEVDWVLDQLQSVVNGQPADHPLERVNRDTSELLDGNIRDRKNDLQEANYVGVTLSDFDAEPIGTEFDQNVEIIVGVRIEGLHHSEWGHIDPDGNNGVQFSANGGLVDQITDALQTEREFPNISNPDITYKSLYLQNHAPQSSQYADYFRYDFEVRLTGHEELP